MKTLARLSTAGFSIFELMIYMGFASFIGLVISNYVSLPAHISSSITTATNEQNSYSSTNIPIDDLKGAIATSVQWNLIDPSQPLAVYNPASNPLFIPWFQVNDPSIAPPALPISYLCYAYSSGKLLREFISGGPPTASPVTACAPVAGDNAQETVIAQGLLPPTAATPLFAKDLAAQNMVILTLQFPGSGPTPITVVRRVHIRS